MGKIALQRLRWGDEWIEAGEPVPEDEPGRNYALAEQLGQIGHDPDGLSAKASQLAFGRPAEPAGPQAPPPAGVELSKLTRAQLDQAAREAGISDPEALPTKAAVIEQLEASS